jgi:anti-sigma factor RsiW
MLVCQDCESYLEAFLDQELSVKESLDMQAHLHSCSACMALVEAECAYRRVVHEQAYEAPLPDTIKLQLIRRAIDGTTVGVVTAESSASWWARLSTWIHPKDFALGMASAAVILLLFSPFSWWLTTDDTTGNFHADRFLQDASMAYRANQRQPMPLEVSASDDKALAEWFSHRLTYSFKVPCITDNATKLMGGRLCRLLDRPSATFVYKRNGKDVMLFAFRGDGLSLPAKNRIRVQDQDLYFHDVSGHPVAAWQHGGIVYSMVGDLNRDDILKIAKTMYYR